jgi:hypothetical protein
MKEGCLFVLFHIEISQSTTPLIMPSTIEKLLMNRGALS